MENIVVRSVVAPSEAEARTMAAPILDGFRSAGWELREALWVPGDRRPGLGESLILSQESQLLLEGEGTLRLSFANLDPLAVAPSVTGAAREPDTFESIGGVRYRRLVPRWTIGIIVSIIGLLFFLAMVSSMPNNPFGNPVPVNGICPPGSAPGMKVDGAGNLTPDGTCQRMTP